MGWVVDLDGVVWLALRPIPGAADAVARLRAAAEEVAFVTNNSGPTLETVESQLDAIGIPATGSVVTSAQAAAGMLEPGSSALSCAGDGVIQALEGRGVRIVDDAPADAVVVGFHQSFDYDAMSRAARAVNAGARLVGTNADATYPTPDGPIPGGGAILASIVAATGVEAEVAGKPHQPMADLVRERVGDQGVVVGDRPETDGLFAAVLGFDFALVLTGITRPEDLPVTPDPAHVAPDLSGLLDKLGIP